MGGDTEAERRRMAITLTALRNFIATNFEADEVVQRGTMDKCIGEYWGNHSTYTVRDRRIALELNGLIKAIRYEKDSRGRRIVFGYKITMVSKSNLKALTHEEQTTDAARDATTGVGK